MEEVNQNDEHLLDGLEGDGIFTSDEAADGLKQAAEALGYDPASVDVKKPRRVMYAKKNCKGCFGLGVMRFVPSPAKPRKILCELPVDQERVRRRRKLKRINGKLKRRPTQKRIRNCMSLEGNKLGKVWNTCLPEPEELKDELLQLRPCKCVRTLEL